MTFINSLGYKLHGVLEKAGDSCVILCHGYGSSSSGDTRVELAKRLKEKNISSFGFDFTGCGESEGTLPELTVTQGVDDLTYAYNHVRNNLKFKKISLLGSSFSGSVALLFAAENEIEKLALKSPVSNWHTLHKMPFLTDEESKKYFKDARQYDLYAVAEKVKQQTLIVHGTADASVPFSQSEELIKHLQNGTLLPVTGADHRYSDAHHFNKMIVTLSDFFAKP